MIVRFESRYGRFRLTVEPQDHFGSIESQILEKLPSNLDPASITVALKSASSDKQPLSNLKGLTFEQLGVR